MPTRAERERERKRRYDMGRPGPRKRGYDGKWEKIRNAYIQEHPLCEYPNCFKQSKHVDHIISLRRGGTHDPENLQALCTTHHSKKTALEDSTFARPKLRLAVNNDGLPRDPKHPWNGK